MVFSLSLKLASLPEKEQLPADIVIPYSLATRSSASSIELLNCTILVLLNCLMLCISVCFNYKDIPAKEICTLLYEEAQAMVGYGKFESTEFIRLITINANNLKEDIIHFFEVFENGAKKLELNHSISLNTV